MSHLQYCYTATSRQSVLETDLNTQVKVVSTSCYEHFSEDLLEGWNRETGDSLLGINAQIDYAFENVDHSLKDAGGKGL